MNILVIKQTSLGDVLHSTGHVRAIKEHFPNCHLTVLTADTSASIYRHNPYIDEIIEFQRYRVKRNWWRHPLWVITHMRDTLSVVRNRHYDLAIDLQGRWKSVVFLYGAHAARRYVKGNWPFLDGFRDRQLHALQEMDRVLEMAGIVAADTHMEFFTSDPACNASMGLLHAAGWRNEPYIVVSPFTRWPSKNWSLRHYADLIRLLPGGTRVMITGEAADQDRADAFVAENGLDSAINLVGKLGLEEFACVVKDALAVVSGDSFAMHLAVACNTPVVALFGPTDEKRVGPGEKRSRVLRADNDCRVCYRRDCPRRCIDGIRVHAVNAALESLVGGRIGRAAS